MKNIFMRVLSGERFYSVWIPYPGLRCGFEAEECISILLGKGFAPAVARRRTDAAEAQQVNGLYHIVSVFRHCSGFPSSAAHSAAVHSKTVRHCRIPSGNPVSVIISFPRTNVNRSILYFFWQINTSQKIIIFQFFDFGVLSNRNLCL